MFSPGTLRSTSGRERCWRFSMSAAVITVTLLATWVMGVGMRVALTTTASSSRPGCAQAGVTSPIRATEL